MQKLYGGLLGTTLAGLSKDNVQMFERLTLATDAKFLPELSVLLKDEFKINSGDTTQKELTSLTHMLKEQNEALSVRFEGIIAARNSCIDSVNGDPNWSPINNIREAIKLQPHHLIVH
jgi:hypothetical protein